MRNRRTPKTRLAIALRGGQAYAEGRRRIEKGNSRLVVEPRVGSGRIVANVPIEDQDVRRILKKLASPEAQEAWVEFLERFSPVLFHVAKLTESDPDHISACFLFICEKLSEKNFRRLRHFRFDGRARFRTWLWAVARNLCNDWRRKEFGRHRIPRSISRLKDIDRHVFRCVYDQGLTREQTYWWLAVRNPTLTRAQVDESCKRIQAALTPRQLWLLSGPQRESECLGNVSRPINGPTDSPIPDPAPSPEAGVVLKERIQALERAFRQLSKPERLLITLRFEQGLTLQEIAELLDLKDPWVVERQIKRVLDGMRKQMSSFEGFRAKTDDASV
jgi:RNA polymerase sigma factor (sigma-70 family)